MDVKRGTGWLINLIIGAVLWIGLSIVVYTAVAWVLVRLAR